MATRKKAKKKKPVKTRAKKVKKKLDFRKKAVKKTVRGKIKAKKTKKTQAASTAGALKIKKDRILGVVTHYFPHVQAAVVKVKKPITVHDSVVIQGHTTNFNQQVESIQIDHVPIQAAKAGNEIGLKVIDRVREGDLVLRP